MIKAALFTKNTRRYSIRIERDLFGDWVILRNFGRKNVKKGRTIVEICENQTSAEARFADLCQYRVNKRHYEQI
jgi:hypothetical protein